MHEYQQGSYILDLYFLVLLNIKLVVVTFAGYRLIVRNPIEK